MALNKIGVGIEDDVKEGQIAQEAPAPASTTSRNEAQDSTRAGLVKDDGAADFGEGDITAKPAEGQDDDDNDDIEVPHGSRWTKVCIGSTTIGLIAVLVIFIVFAIQNGGQKLDSAADLLR